MQHKEEEKKHNFRMLLLSRQQELPHGVFQNLVVGNPGYGISIFMFLYEDRQPN